MNVMLVERNSCCDVANAFLSRLELSEVISMLKTSKIFKSAVFAKHLQV